VRHDDDRELFLQFMNQFFHLRGRDWIERGAGLVHQQNLRIDRDRARDAQPLLLSSGKAESAFVQAVLHFVPQCRAA
jgi:hypothetical protein